MCLNMDKGCTTCLFWLKSRESAFAIIGTKDTPGRRNIICGIPYKAGMRHAYLVLSCVASVWKHLCPDRLVPSIFRGCCDWSPDPQVLGSYGISTNFDFIHRQSVKIKHHTPFPSFRQPQNIMLGKYHKILPVSGCYFTNTVPLLSFRAVCSCACEPMASLMARQSAVLPVLFLFSAAVVSFLYLELSGLEAPEIFPT